MLWFDLFSVLKPIYVSLGQMKSSTRKQEILTVAAHLFKEKGYKAVSMRDIAQAMDIKAASLYNHIKNKQEILATIILEVAEEFTRGMSAVIAEESRPIQKIEKIVEKHIDITVRYPNGLAALNNDWMHLENEDLSAVVKMREDYEENFRSIIKQGILEKEIKPRHPEVILFSMLSTLRTMYLWYRKRDAMEISTLKRDTLAVLLKGIV